jgi:Predicted xylanase/chitin deacetylase
VTAPRLTLRPPRITGRLLVAAVAAAIVALSIAAVANAITLLEAAVIGGTIVMTGALGLIALEIRRLRRAVENGFRSLTKHNNDLSKQLTKSVGSLRDLLQPASPRSATPREVPTSTAARSANVRGATTSPRHAPAAEPASSEPAAGLPTVEHVSGPGGSIIRTGNQTVALTFDDGPDRETTPELLDLLRSHQVRATFFLIGHRAHLEKDLVARIADEGHVLANHSWTHRMDLAKATDEEIIAELQNTNEAILAGAPGHRVEFFRAPGGRFDERLVTLAKAQGMASVYWTLSSNDWDDDTYGTGESMVNRIVATLRKDTRPGTIVLSHDHQGNRNLPRPDTVAAYRILLPWLKDNFNLAPLTLDGKG